MLRPSRVLVPALWVVSVLLLLAAAAGWARSVWVAESFIRDTYWPAPGGAVGPPDLPTQHRRWR